MLDQEQIKTIANESHTSKVIFDNLSKRVRFRRNTNLTKLHYQLINSGEKIVEDEYLQTFKQLQDLGVGALIHGRGNKPTRFKWNYNLKDIGKAGTSNEEVDVKEIYRPATKHVSEEVQETEVIKPVRKRGRPAKAKQTKAKQNGSMISITLQLSANSSPEDIKSLLDLANQLK